MRRRKKKVIRLHPKMCSPEECEHCLYIGEGDFVCDKDEDYTTVIEDFEPTDDYLRCAEG